MVQIGSQGTALFWMLGHVDQSSSASTSVMADNYLELMAVSVNGTTKACYQTIFDILSDPQCIPALREELRAVIAEHGMRQDSDGSQIIPKTTYTKSRLLDSCIKESLRCNPSQLIGMNRYLEKDHRFSNGMELKKGTFTSFNMWGVTHSSNTATYSPKLNAAVGNLGPELVLGRRR
ncbi:hypothetical protein NLU13_2459 [Sarocladium strictum]|uniref:Uncharacterized protein n=1 Tax=Sarocladium strictum TaxID=5046 RepID=A0AA39GSV7_SARSR|nr:hypothetical protein NLU13_2459 [Sarocladium strictum]